MWGDVSLWFWFAFPCWLLMLSIFSCTCWPYVCFLWNNVYLNYLALFKSNYLLCCYRVKEVPYIFWRLNHYQIYSLIFSHSIGYLFILLFPLLCRKFLVWCGPTCLFCSCYLCLRCHIQKIIAKTNVMKLFPYGFS